MAKALKNETKSKETKSKETKSKLEKSNAQKEKKSLWGLGSAGSRPG